RALDRNANGATAVSENPAASAVYRARLVEARNLLAKLELALDAHEEDSSRYPNSWGPVGDLGRVIAELRETVRFMGEEAGE
ncbi:MAG: hypothetical protein AAF368_19805, partial [Planctomycetota bacterium]